VGEGDVERVFKEATGFRPVPHDGLLLWLTQANLNPRLPPSPDLRRTTHRRSQRVPTLSSSTVDYDNFGTSVLCESSILPRVNLGGFLPPT